MSGSNKSLTKERLLVMQAYVDGKEIEYRAVGIGPWLSAGSPIWNWVEREYRVKPEPPMEIWVNVYPDGRKFTYESLASAEDRRGGKTIKLVEVRDGA